MGRLSDGAFRMCINLFMLANRQVPRDGRLPDFEDIAWILRLSMEDFHKYWQGLERAGITCVADESPAVTHFEDRQQATPVAERVRQYRERQARQDHEETAESNIDETLEKQVGNGVVTERYRDIDKEEDIDKEQEKNNKTITSANADYQAIRKRWFELFPGKSKPRVDNRTLTGKVKTRMKATHFQENWDKAMGRASQSSFLNQSTWFDLEWFIKNDANYEKCLAGKYNDNPNGNGRHPSQAEQRSYQDVINDAVDEVYEDMSNGRF
jgi:hypothetical protein